MKVIFNGNVIDESEAKISISDKAYWFDFAVYSSLKVVRGKVFFPEFHVERLFESARLIDLEHQFKLEEVEKWIEILVKENKLDNALLRIVLVGDADFNQDAKLFIFSVGGLTFYPDKLYKQGAKLITWQGERIVPEAKTKDLLNSFLAMREAKKAGALDALLIDRSENIREGTRSNFFAIKDGELITPPIGQVLGGIARKIVLEVSKDDFIIKEKDISLKNLKEYDEFFITSTSMNVMPIRQIDDYLIDTTFKKTKLIAKLFKEYYRITN